ncbi:MAG: lipopolysaccharide biosynthesis protein [Rhodospirillales bacterium]|nr:lipopolysaccharide biosynthesis protein [Rhodospirillales bacterium]
MVAARLLSRIIDLCALLILARLLTPVDFGLVAIAMTMVTLLEAALELPLSQALVQLPYIEPHHFHTAFTISLLRGLVLFALCFSFAPAFAKWYGHTSLTPLVQALSLAPAIRGLQNPRLAEYAKALNFKYEFYLELAGKSLAFLSGSIAAYLTHSYWSIAICTIISPVSTSLLGYIVIPYRPRLSLQDWRLFRDFLGWISFSQIVSALNFQSEQLLLGKLMPTKTFGLFTTASNITYIPIAALFGPVLRPLLSAFTQVRGEKIRLSDIYQRASSAVVTIGLPVLIGLAAIAQPLVWVLLGPQWAAATPLFRWLSISIIPYLFGMLLTPLGMATGHSREIARRNSVQLFVKLPLLIIGVVQYGFAGVIAARLISETVTALFCMASIRKLTGISIAAQFLVNLRAITSSLVMLTGILFLDHIFHFSSIFSYQLIMLSLLVSVGSVAYISCLALFWYLAGCPPGLEDIALRWLRRLFRQNQESYVATGGLRTVPNPTSTPAELNSLARQNDH